MFGFAEGSRQNAGTFVFSCDQPLLGTAIDIQNWLVRDQETDYVDRLARDRAIGTRLRERADAQRVLSWWGLVDLKDDRHGEESVGARVERARSQVSIVLVAFGVLAGWGSASAAFAYDGTAPINRLLILAVLVALPLFLAVVSLLAALARGGGLVGLSDALSLTAIGRWGLHWISRWSKGAISLARPSTSRLCFWQLFLLSQYFAVGFFASLLIVSVLKVAFTDLAFGWSSTLQLDAGSVRCAFDLLSWPWAAWWADAAPSEALVEASRFYRLESGQVEMSRAAQLGLWWPFVLACIVFWGLLPRVLMLLLGRWRLRAAEHDFLLADGEVVALLDRLAAPVIEYGGDRVRSDVPEIEGVSPSLAIPDPGSARWVSWNGALSAQVQETWLQSQGVDPAGLLSLNALDTDDALRRSLAAVAGADRVIIAVKGWEPPTLEFTDFLQLVRQVIGNKPVLIVLPIGVAGGVDDGSREIFASAVARLDDPRAYVGAAS